MWSRHLDIDALLNSMEMGVVVHEPDTRILGANPRALELLQVSHAEAVSSDAFDPEWEFIDEHGAPLAVEDYPVNQVLARGQPIRNFKLGFLPSNSQAPTWALCNAYQRPVDNRIVVTFIDITAEQEAKQALALALEAAQRSEQQLQATAFRLEVALAAIDAHTYDLDVDTGIVAFDTDFSTVLGYSSGELANVSLQYLGDITHPDDIDGRMASLSAVVAGSTDTYHHTARLQHRDGHWVWVENRGRVLDRHPDGKPRHLVGVLVDITHRKRMEDTLLQSQKMEALGTLAGGIAHDFNNLLVPVMGYAELAKRDLPEQSKAVSHLDRILTAAERARELVQKILLISRSSALDKEPVSLVKLAEEVLIVVRASAPKGLVVNTDLPDDLSNIHADPAKIYQVLLNLCTNAVQAMSEEGELHLSLRKVHSAENLPAATQHAAGYVEITLRDNGPGMDADTRARIFDPFFTTKVKGEQRGTGLGLSIVASVVEEHAGSISVSSEPGQGTTFTLYLPASNESTSERSPEPALVSAANEALIMLVDDEEMVRELGTAMLQQLGYRVAAFADGLSAVTAFQSAPDTYSAVLTDYEMPGLSGPELIQQLKAIRHDVPTVLITGYSNLATEESKTNFDCDRVLAKPYDLSRLSEAVQSVI